MSSTLACGILLVSIGFGNYLAGTYSRQHDFQSPPLVRRKRSLSQLELAAYEHLASGI